MAQVKIVTDSTAMLTPEEAAELDVKIVPLSITIDGTSYQDGVTLSRVEFMDKMAEAKNLPQTSQPALGYFTEVYESIMAADPETQIISIHLTKGLSGTADAARQAALMVEGDITTLDSEFIDRAEGFQVLAAAKLAAAGASKEAVLAEIQRVRDNTQLYLTVSNLDNLVAGGRLSKTAGFIAGVLNIKVGAHIEQGNINVEVKGRGAKSTKAYLKKIVEQMQAAPNGVAAIGISHAGIPVEAQELADKVNEIFPDVKIVVQQTSPTVSTHTGAGAIGFSYLLK
ncbi:DegV family protein [Weissella cibaria]|uniref:DegV domain-containing protein YejH n=1 Tax=Weissella cibaria TaxID=137591 RepID=A0A0N7HAV0_9LACO|nr:DegV family protein [Weissella cibaria]ALI33344.1 fatty acid-binding protein DegV [Weissella cibaria]AWF95784.1 DegV domain-containing protein YejH [Weissella cibaria]MBD1501869.1 DegV family protein [Weissella cibaria]MDH5011882.1 DegV family protein [Weissella cibaria]QDG80159.1 DegV family protein [Weissella cibaria]